MYDSFIEDGEVPSEILNICNIETNGMNLISKKYNVVIGLLMDIVDKVWIDEGDEED